MGRFRTERPIFCKVMIRGRTLLLVVLLELGGDWGQGPK